MPTQWHVAKGKKVNAVVGAAAVFGDCGDGGCRGDIELAAAVAKSVAAAGVLGAAFVDLGLCSYSTNLRFTSTNLRE